MIRERTRGRQKATKKRGRHVIRPGALSPAQIQHMRELLVAGKTQREVAELLGVLGKHSGVGGSTEMNGNFFGCSSLSAQEFERYYNEVSADRRGYIPRHLPLESLQRRNLLIPALDNKYTYWQIFILHDIMQMKVEYVFDFTNDGLFDKIKNLDFHNIESGEFIAGVLFDQSIKGYRRSNSYYSCYDAVARYFELKRQFEESYIWQDKGERGEKTNWNTKLNELAKQSFVQCNISPEKLLEFLKYQCARWEEESYSKIADEYKKNIEYTVEIYRRITGDTFDRVTELVGSGDREYFLPHERLVLDRIFPNWEEAAKYRASHTIKSICQRNLGLQEQDIKAFKACISDKDFQHFYITLNEIIENFNVFNPEGKLRLRRALRSLAICFEEWCEKLSGVEGKTLKEKLKGCWSPNASKRFFGKKGYYDNFTKGRNNGITNSWRNIESIKFKNLEPQICDKHASILLKAALIRNYLIHNKIDHEENVPVTQYAITITEAIILTWLAQTELRNIR